MLLNPTDFIDFTKVQIGFDTAAFIAIIASAGAFLWEYRKRKKLDREDRFVESARAAVVEALNREAKDFAFAHARLKTSRFRLSSAHSGLQERIPVYVQAELDSLGVEDRDVGQPYLLEEELDRIREFLRAARDWEIELTTLFHGMMASEQVLAPYWQNVDRASSRFTMARSEIASQASLHVGNDLQTLLYKFIEDTEICTILLESYSTVVSRQREARFSDIFPLYEFQQLLSRRLTGRHIEILEAAAADDLAKERSEIDSLRAYSEWKLEVLRMHCESISHDPWSFFTGVTDNLHKAAILDTEALMAAAARRYSSLTGAFLIE